MIPLCDLIVGLVAPTLAFSVLASASSNGHVGTLINATSPLDPFQQLRIRATPKPSEPVCCLIPLSSDPLPTTAEFLSFEEWKSKQLELQAQAQSANQTPLPDTPAAEAPPGLSLMTSAVTFGDTDPPLASPTESTSPHFRVPLTDRFNYASLDCSARVHTSHRSARSPSAILSSKKDRYMLSPCSSDPNFIVVELCDDIRIDTVQLANFEFFSGVFREFRVSVAQTYTTDGKGWVEAGTYRAKNIRGVQSFHPLVELRPFYRYIRIDFLSHYGSEFYCPISLLRVYGLTQLEEWKWEVWQGATQSSGPEVSAVDKVVNETSLESTMTMDGSIMPATEEELRPMASIDPTPTRDGADHVPSSSETSVGWSHHQPTQQATILPTSITTTIPPDPTPTLAIELSVALDSEAVSSLTMIPNATQVSPPNPIKDAEPNTTSPFETASNVATHNLSQLNPPAISSIMTLIPLPSQSPVPSGESIYRTIMNRLAMLETNTTLYQKYVEEQTLQVREALRRLEEDVGRLEGISKAQQHTFSKTVQELERRRLQMEVERWELLIKVNHLADEVVLEKRLGIAQLCLLLTVLVFMTLTRGSRTDAISLLDGTIHRLNNFGRHSPWSSIDLTQMRGRSPTPTPRHASATQKRNEKEHSAVSPCGETDALLPVTLPTTPPARPQTPRSSLSRRPTTPRHHDVFRPSSSERPLTRLRRSNSHTTPANTSLSAKRFARSSHLHEVRQLIRRHAMMGSDENRHVEPDGGIDGSPRPQLHSTLLSDQGVSPRWTPEYDGSEAESWVDTEPGSELGVDYNEAEFDKTGNQEMEVTPEHGPLQGPILRAPQSSLTRHFENHNPPSPASVTG